MDDGTSRWGNDNVSRTTTTGHDYNGTQAVGISIAVYCQKCSTTDCQLALETTYNPYSLCKTHQPPRPNTRTWENLYLWYWQQVQVFSGTGKCSPGEPKGYPGQSLTTLL